MSNFSYLKEKEEFSLFADATIEAERVFKSSPAMCAVGCRKALELAVHWVYAADTTMHLPYRNHLDSLLNESCFRNAINPKMFDYLMLVKKIGNAAVHTSSSIKEEEALHCLKILFVFIQWIEYCYGKTYTKRKFSVKEIPAIQQKLDIKKIKEQESLISQKDAEIEALKQQVERMSFMYTSIKKENKDDRELSDYDISEAKTRKLYIDVDLKMMGWKFDSVDADVWEEYEFNDMKGILGQKGYADYVLFGKDGLPLAVVEAKRTSKDPNMGLIQARLYADCLERKFGRRPFIYTTNGFDTYFLDDISGPQRKVSGITNKDDLQRLMNRRNIKKDLMQVEINDNISGRYYQKEAIRSICEHFSKGYRRSLLVMATGTGKTRTAISLVDVLSRGNYVTNILFLADRIALVQQAKDAFESHLKSLNACDLTKGKADKDARVVVSTYPTILNAIDQVKNEQGFPLFSPAHFDLIIVDESHRSIFKKYKEIFAYFDAMMVGLTATPKTQVDSNTYDFFEMENGIPTYAYDYETAVYQDHYLVPYYNYEVKMKFIEEGIHYDELSEEDKQRYEEVFSEDEVMPEEINSEALNKYVFNQKTVDHVLQDIMERGIKVNDGDLLGKTIIFAQNQNHAKYIMERFGKLYPYLPHDFATIVVHGQSYVTTSINAFKQKEMPRIVISVDMMDTGVDVPECVNLVFFKKVRSKIKFWQMIGRGTRLCSGLSCVDIKDGQYEGKNKFFIFDYCGNFEFFREKQQGIESNVLKSLTENIYCKKVKLCYLLQDVNYAEEKYQTFRKELADFCHERVMALNTELFTVRMHREYVEKYKKRSSFDCLESVQELNEHIAPLVHFNDNDQAAKRFDNLIYGIMIEMIEGGKVTPLKHRVIKCAMDLEKKVAIPQVNAALPSIKKVKEDSYWEANDILSLEETRIVLRELMKFLDKEEVKKLRFNLQDVVLSQSEGDLLDDPYDFEDYKLKVNRYIEENMDMQAIYKLTHNIPLDKNDHKELEVIFKSVLGSEQDYKREYGDEPIGLLIRKIAHLDHEAVMQAFSQFINDASLNPQQIAFVHKIIQYVEVNGYVEHPKVLMKPPFDKPLSFVKMFDAKTRERLLFVINKIKDNAYYIE